VKQPLAEEGKRGAAVHLALERLEAIDLPLRLALTPLERQRRPDGGLVAADATGKAAQFGDATVLGSDEPRVEGGERATTPEYAAEYARRAGIEGTLSRGVRVLRMRRTRYIGLARTHLSHVLTAAGMNLLRVGDWLAGALRAKTRQSPFVALMTQPTAA